MQNCSEEHGSIGHGCCNLTRSKTVYAQIHVQSLHITITSVNLTHATHTSTTYTKKTTGQSRSCNNSNNFTLVSFDSHKPDEVISAHRQGLKRSWSSQVPPAARFYRKEDFETCPPWLSLVRSSPRCRLIRSGLWLQARDTG